MGGTDDITATLVEAGVIDESEVPFDEKENEAPEIEDDKIDEIVLPYTMKLSVPFSIGSTKVEKIVFKNRLTAGMMKHFPFSKEEDIKQGHYYPVLQNMTGENSAVIEGLAPIDWWAAISIVHSFFG